MKILFVTVVLLFSSPFLFSAVSEVIIQGVIVSYDKKSVILVQDNGKQVKVSRARIPKFYKLKTGKRVQAVFGGKKLVDMIKKQEDKKEKKRK